MINNKCLIISLITIISLLFAFLFTGCSRQIKSIKNYLESNKISSGNSGGVSDISLYDTKTEEFIFDGWSYYIIIII